ncbi:putative membrane protein [Salmonella phage seszw]|nr:putative membrane protein [Salmonella phage seszw]
MYLLLLLLIYILFIRFIPFFSPYFFITKKSISKIMFLSIKFGISVNGIKRLNIMNYKDFFGINEKNMRDKTDKCIC